MLRDTAEGTHDGAESRRPPRAGVVVVLSSASATSRVLAFGAEPLVIGRDTPELADLPDERLSRSHCRIAISEAGWTIRDLGSRNGTFVEGEPVHGERVVALPRVIRAADTLLVPCRDVASYRPVEIAGDAIVGGALHAAFDAVDRAAATSETLALAGESGTGKELAARRYHARGPAGKGPFIALNCAAIPEGLAEAMLFGAKKGAYSGATDMVGQVQAADGGVLFLDEAAELDLKVQAKLLRAIETHEVIPLGATQPVRVALRLCLATHVPLRRAVADGRFRADLYHRIAPPEVVLPALRDRLDEIPHHVLAAAGGRAVHVKLVEACMLRPWPGNVRELRKHVRDAAAAATDQVRVEHLAAAAGERFEHPAEPAGTRSYVHRAKQLTKETISRALAEHAGNVTRAARSLGMQRTQLYREMERHGLDKGR